MRDQRMGTVSENASQRNALSVANADAGVLSPASAGAFFIRINRERGSTGVLHFLIPDRWRCQQLLDLFNDRVLDDVQVFLCQHGKNYRYRE
ncbi:MAG: hypothetical protein KF749_13120 [Bacteroidetes bacterium]|nr:hypothetical protein [Bacteroidota bacterium]MCW5894363.1 hypothetical protein [Bacteroidota bacterium]